MTEYTPDEGYEDEAGAGAWEEEAPSYESPAPPVDPGSDSGLGVEPGVDPGAPPPEAPPPPPPPADGSAQAPPPPPDAVEGSGDLPPAPPEEAGEEEIAEDVPEDEILAEDEVPEDEVLAENEVVSQGEVVPEDQPAPPPVRVSQPPVEIPTDPVAQHPALSDPATDTTTPPPVDDGWGDELSEGDVYVEEGFEQAVDFPPPLDAAAAAAAWVPATPPSHSCCVPPGDRMDQHATGLQVVTQSTRDALPGVDSNGDGRVDFATLDANEDGAVDTWLLDLTGSGNADAVYIDADGDGMPDTLSTDAGVGAWTSPEPIPDPGTRSVIPAGQPGGADLEALLNRTTDAQAREVICCIAEAQAGPEELERILNSAQLAWTGQAEDSGGYEETEGFWAEGDVEPDAERVDPTPVPAQPERAITPAAQQICCEDVTASPAAPSPWVVPRAVEAPAAPAVAPEAGAPQHAGTLAALSGWQPGAPISIVSDTPQVGAPQHAGTLAALSGWQPGTPITLLSDTPLPTHGLATSPWEIASLQALQGFGPLAQFQANWAAAINAQPPPPSPAALSVAAMDGGGYEGGPGGQRLPLSNELSAPARAFMGVGSLGNASVSP